MTDLDALQSDQQLSCRLGAQLEALLAAASLLLDAPWARLDHAGRLQGLPQRRDEAVSVGHLPQEGLLKFAGRPFALTAKLVMGQLRSPLDHRLRALHAKHTRQSVSSETGTGLSVGHHCMHSTA